MKTIHWLSANEYDEWDAFVKRHPKGLVYHLSAWKQLLEIAFGHIHGQFLVLRNGDGQIQAGLPLYAVKSWVLGNRLVSIPFATMCDPLISSKEEFDLLWPAIEDVSVKNKTRRIEIRIRRTNTECLPAPLAASTHYKHHYLTLEKSTDELFRSFNKSNISRAIKKAKQEGVIIEERNDEQSLRVLHSFLVSTRRKHSLPPMPFAFFRAMYQVLSPDHVTLYLAIHEGRPVGGILVSKFKDLWTSEYSGDVSDSVRGVSQLIYWETIQHAKNSGAANFSFGRTSLDNTGLLTHKRRWATIEEDLTDYISSPNVITEQSHEAPKPGNHSKYDSTVKLLIKYSPGLVQKFIGDFVYRHLG